MLIRRQGTSPPVDCRKCPRVCACTNKRITRDQTAVSAPVIATPLRPAGFIIGQRFCIAFRQFLYDQTCNKSFTKIRTGSGNKKALCSSLPLPSSNPELHHAPYSVKHLPVTADRGTGNSGKHISGDRGRSTRFANARSAIVC